MNVQFFIVNEAAIIVSTEDGMVVSPGLQLGCGICPTRVFVRQLTNLLPLLEHARQHEQAAAGYIGSTISIEGLSKGGGLGQDRPVDHDRDIVSTGKAQGIARREYGR